MLKSLIFKEKTPITYALAFECLKTSENLWLTTYDLYRQRWAVEIFFNEIKNILHLEHPISRNKNGIMVEVYSALIFHLLTRIVIALAAQKTDQPVDVFSFSRCFDLLKAFLSTHLGEILRATQMTLICFLQHLVEAVTRMGLKDRLALLL